MNKRFKFIMLIDDDRPTNFLSELIIKKEDCCDKVESYLSPEEALSFIQENAQTDELPDLIFLDINMPAMNGWEFLEEYEKIKFSPENTPIICMITTSLNPDDELRASKIEVLSGYYLKPFSVEILRDIRASISEKQLMTK